MSPILRLADVSSAFEALSRRPGFAEVGRDLDTGIFYLNLGTRAAPDWVPLNAESLDGGSQSICLAAANGLVKDWPPEGFDPDVTTELWIDPRPQPRAAGREYALYNFIPASGNNNSPVALVTKATPDGVYFRPYQAAKVTLGPTEPSWADGIVHGTAKWTEVAYGAWAPLHSYADDAHIVANGILWYPSAPLTSGGSQPDWSTAPNIADFVADGDGFWYNNGPVVTWAANAVLSFPCPPAGPTPIHLLPTTPAGFLYDAQVGLSAFAIAGNADPAWDAVSSSDGTYWSDGEIIWQESTDTPQCVITGLAAASTARVLKLRNVLATDDPNWSSVEIGPENADEAAGDWSNEAVSEAPNRFFLSGSSGFKALTAGKAIDLVYSTVRSRWELALVP